MRRLICNNHKSIMKYNDTAWQLLQFHNIPQRLKVLEAFFDSTDIDLWCVRLNILDEQVTDILLHTKKQYRKLRTDKVEYSLEVSAAAERWYAWRIAQKVSNGDI